MSSSVCESLTRKHKCATRLRLLPATAMSLSLRGGAEVIAENMESVKGTSLVDTCPWDVVTGPGRFRYVVSTV